MKHDINKHYSSWQWVIFFIAGLLFVLFFYAGFYKYLLAADSTSLTLENTLHVAKAHQEANIIVLGDSTAAEEFRPNVFNQITTRGKAINLGMPGTWFYSHYWMQELIKQENRKVDTVILILGPDEFTNTGNNRLIGDLQYHKTRISIFDARALFDFSDSDDFLKTNLLSVLFKPVLFKSDLNDLVLNPINRLIQVPRNLVWLNRRIDPNDLLWEDTRDFDVCNIGPLSDLEVNLANSLASNDATASAIYKMNLSAYQGRTKEKIINGDIQKNLTFLIKEMANNYKYVYVLNAPIYARFEEVYPTAYLNSISDLTKKVIEPFDDVQYIPVDPAISTDCTNFMDVVHLNLRGGTKLTEYLANYLNKSE